MGNALATEIVCSGIGGTQRGHATFSRPALRYADRRPMVRRCVRNFCWDRIRASTALLGWAMLPSPKSYAPELEAHKEDMLRFLGQHYAALTGGQGFGDAFAIFVGIVFGFLLISAVNTAIVALIGVIYMMAQDGEMPPQFARLNNHGVPLIPLIAAVAIPILVLGLIRQFEGLAGLYAIGVVGAISVNLGACTFNKRLGLRLVRTPDHGRNIPGSGVSGIDYRKNETRRAVFCRCAWA